MTSTSTLSSSTAPSSSVPIAMSTPSTTIAASIASSTPNQPSAMSRVASSPSLDDDKDDPVVKLKESDFDCSLCFRLMYDPITIPQCGHSFCRQCLWLARQSKAQCPLCRTPLGSYDPQSAATSQMLHSLIHQARPQAYRSRKAETRMEKRAKRQRYGLFLSYMPHFPGATTQLHLYEPRYRIMINDAWAGNRQFIIVRAHRDRSINSYQHVPTLDTATIAGGAAHEPHQPIGEAAANAPEAPRGAGAADHPPAAAAAAPVIPDVPQRQPPVGGIIDIGAVLPLNALGVGGVAAAGVLPPPVPGLPAAIAGMAPLQQPPTHPPGWPEVQEGDVACVVNITDCRFAPDGRSLVTIVGLQRVRLSQIALESEGFGLLTAEAEPILDRPAAGLRRIDDDDDDDEEEKKVGSGNTRGGHESKTERKRLTPSTTTTTTIDAEPISTSDDTNTAMSEVEIEHKLQGELAAQIRSLLELFASESRTSLTRLQSVHGPIPVDHSEFTFWLCRALPAEFDLKEQCLASNSVIERMELCLVMMGRCLDTARRSQRWTSIAVAAVLLAIFIYLAFYK